MGLLIAASITSCSEEQGTNPGEDSRPAVIIYQYAPGEGYNADNDIKLRISANSQTQEAYYLCELTSEKADFILESRCLIIIVRIIVLAIYILCITSLCEVC